MENIFTITGENLLNGATKSTVQEYANTECKEMANGLP